MKHNFFLKKTLYLLFSFLSTFALSACGQNSTGNLTTSNETSTPSAKITTNSPDPSDSDSTQTSENESLANNDAITAYENFLAGSINAQDLKNKISDGVVTIQDISLEPDYKTYYTLFDMNADEIPELHLRPIVGGSYAIFTYLDGQIVLWHDGPDYETPLNNKAILYERESAAPTHINYYYLVLDSFGNEMSKVFFSKYHSVDESITTESPDYDVFMFEEEEVSEEEWNTRTNEYLSNTSDLIIWSELPVINNSDSQTP